MEDEKDKELNGEIKNDDTNNISNEKKEADYCFTKNQTNNNLERFKNLAQSVKTSHKNDSEFNKSSINNSKLVEKKKMLNQLDSIGRKINNINVINNNHAKYEDKKNDSNNNFENSLHEFSKNLVLLSPNKKSINFDKVNLSYLNNNNINELVTGLVSKE